MVVFITALCSGLIATIVTLIVQHFSRKHEEKVRIFKVLMSKRYDIAAEESVEAMNMIDVIFYSSKEVRSAWKDFYETAHQPDSDTKNQAIADKHLRLLEIIAKKNRI